MNLMMMMTAMKTMATPPASPLRIQSTYSMDEEEAEAESESEHQLAEYEYRGQKGKANLNMVRLR